jgi:hypothetical protein
MGMSNNSAAKDFSNFQRSLKKSICLFIKVIKAITKCGRNSLVPIHCILTSSCSLYSMNALKIIQWNHLTYKDTCCCCCCCCSYNKLGSLLVVALFFVFFFFLVLETWHDPNSYYHHQRVVPTTQVKGLWNRLFVHMVVLFGHHSVWMYVCMYVLEFKKLFEFWFTS